MLFVQVMAHLHNVLFPNCESVEEEGERREEDREEREDRKEREREERERREHLEDLVRLSLRELQCEAAQQNDRSAPLISILHSFSHSLSISDYEYLYPSTFDLSLLSLSSRMSNYAYKHYSQILHIAQAEVTTLST